MEISSSPKENAAPADTGNGADDEKTWKNLQHQNTSKLGSNSSHNRAIRAIEYALMLDSVDAWDGVAIVLARLTIPERMSLAYAALVSLKPEEAEQAYCEAHVQAGPPLTPLLSAMDEAAFWADMAAPEELDAYCLASFRRMRPERQTAFLEHVQGGQRDA